MLVRRYKPPRDGGWRLVHRFVLSKSLPVSSEEGCKHEVRVLGREWIWQQYDGGNPYTAAAWMDKRWASAEEIAFEKEALVRRKG